MAELKLARLPDRTPVRLGINILPDLHQDLVDYAAHYARAYGAEVQIAELIPAMLASFIESDRGFQRSRGSLSKAN
jgi:hypothetical protein